MRTYLRLKRKTRCGEEQAEEFVESKLCTAPTGPRVSTCRCVTSNGSDCITLSCEWEILERTVNGLLIWWAIMVTCDVFHSTYLGR